MRTPINGSSLISIALCTYNGQRFLEQQLDSLLNQTYQKFEIVVVDDCSTDGSMAILKRYAECDPRFRVFANEKNVGFKENFQIALSRCSGELIAPCDQDDIWLPEKLSSLIEAIGDHLLAYCDSQLVDSDGCKYDLRMSDVQRMTTMDNPMAFAITNCVSGHAMLFRREVVESLPPVPEEFFHDWWITAVAAGRSKIIFCNKVLVHYRQHGGTVTNIVRAFVTRKPPPSRGHKAKELLNIGQRIERLKSLQSPYQQLMTAWSQLWNKRESQWISLRLGLLMIKHRQSIFRMSHDERDRSLRRAIRYCAGLKLKRLFNPRGYA